MIKREMKVDHVAIYVYMTSLFLIHLGYFAVFLGVFTTIPSFIKYLNVGIQILLCSFLMIRFHPFRENYKLKPADTMFIFGSAILLFTNLVLVELVQIPKVGYYINHAFKLVGKNTQTPTLQVSVI